MACCFALLSCGVCLSPKTCAYAHDWRLLHPDVHNVPFFAKQGLDPAECDWDAVFCNLRGGDEGGGAPRLPVFTALTGR